MTTAEAIAPVDSGRLLDTRGVCELIGCGPSTVWRLRVEGLLKPVKLGRLVRFKRADVQRLIDEHYLGAENAQ